jgi:hypothetical protein
MWKKPNREDGKNEFLKIRNQQLFSLEMSETVQRSSGILEWPPTSAAMAEGKGIIMKERDSHNWASKKVLVTGAGGFIGSHLCEELISLGANVTAMIRYTGRSDWATSNSWTRQ